MFARTWRFESSLGHTYYEKTRYLCGFFFVFTQLETIAEDSVGSTRMPVGAENRGNCDRLRQNRGLESGLEIEKPVPLSAISQRLSFRHYSYLALAK